MTKDEAIAAMKAGEKVTHKHFLDTEWITMEGNLTIITEEGYSISTVEFWGYRQSESFNNDWSIYKQSVPFSKKYLIVGKINFSQDSAEIENIHSHKFCSTQEELIESTEQAEKDGLQYISLPDYNKPFKATTVQAEAKIERVKNILKNVNWNHLSNKIV